MSELTDILCSIGKGLCTLVFGNIGNTPSNGNSPGVSQYERFHYDCSSKEILEVDSQIDKYLEYAAAHNKPDDNGLEITLMDGKTRLRMLRHIKPDRSQYSSIQNIALAMAVKDSQHKFLLVRTYYMSDCIKRCDDFDDYGFAVITSLGIFKAGCKEYRDGSIGGFTKEVLCPIDFEQIKAAIRYYLDSSNSHAYEAMMQAEYPDFMIHRLEFRIQGIIFPRELWW